MKKKWYDKISSIFNAIISIALALIMSGCSWSLAWFSDNTQIDLNESVAHGSVLTQYFESGDGTKESPFEIKRPIQLYYFSWLQNLGFFNEDLDKNEEADTVYFYLSDDIDMTKFTLPPIGTGEYPFIGNFDGNGKVVSNLTVNNNEESMTNKPEEGSLAGVEIVGFFGVVGNLEGGTQYSYDPIANEVKNVILNSVTVKTESQTKKALIGIAVGYMNGNVKGVGVIDSKVNISANTTALNASFTGNISDYSVIGYCTDDFKEEVVLVNTDVATPLVDQDITVKDNSADGEGQGWGGSIAMDAMFTRLQGIMKNETTRNTSYVYERKDLESAKGKIVTLSTEKTEKRVFADPKIGSFVFSPRGDDNYSDQWTYLSGGTTVTKYKYSYGEETIAYYIKDGKNYLRLNGTNLQNTTNLSLATKWIFSNGANGGTAYAEVDGVAYYLMENDDSFAVSAMHDTDYPTLWTYNNNQLSNVPSKYKISSGSNYLTINNGNIANAMEANAVEWTLSNGTSGGTISAVVNGTTYYLRYSDGLTLTTDSSQASSWTYNNNRLSTGNRYLRYNYGWTTTTSSRNASIALTLEEAEYFSVSIEETVATTIDYEEVSYKENGREVENGFNNDNGSYNDAGTFSSKEAGVTYFPLAANNDYTVKESNTGYVVSSSYSPTTTNTFPYGTGDIRVSYYGRNKVTNLTQPKTMTYKSVKSNTGFSTISNRTEDTMKNLGLEKYADCYQEFQDSVADQLYGLHFMQATININSFVTLPKAKIINKEYDNYQVPTNCIDFHLAEQGFINFFAGTYFGKNNSFFSLHKIERDANDKITAIKEIEYIYGKLDSGNLIHSPYYYKYVGDAKYYDKDGKATSTLPTGYDVIFKTEWIKSPTGVGDGDNQLYYFEVPVNAGEYALGSAGEDKIGAYLIYLDLAANAQNLDRTQTIEKITTTKSSVSMPTGVAVLETKDEQVNPLNNAFVSVASGYGSAGGEISFKKEGAEITQTSTSNNVKATYVGEGVTLYDGNEKEMNPPNDALTVIETTVVERITWEDFNISTQQQEPTTVTTRTTVTNSEGTTPTIKVTVGGEDSARAGYDFKELPTMTSYIRISYFESDAKVTIEYEPTTAKSGETVNLQSYTITVTSDKDIVLSAVLLSNGATVDINGVTLTQTKQNIEVKASTA